MMATSLSNKIAGILSAAPASFDPEEDINVETTARVVDKTGDEESDEEIISKFRKQNVEPLEDVDTRYKGKRASRSKLNTNDWSTDEDGDEPILDSGSDGLESQEDEETSEGEEVVEKEGDISDREDNVTFESENEQEATFKHIDQPEASVQIQKGQCVQEQLKLWENFLEMRIQLQKCVIAGNKLPQPFILPDDKKENSLQLTETTKVLTGLLDKFLQLQLLLVKKYPETKLLFSGDTKTTKIEDNEEIPSDTEDEQQNESDEEEVPAKKQKYNYQTELGKRHDFYKKYRDSVIQKWDDKTRIARSKSGNTFHSVLKQIDHILSDKEKLTKRTQLCRIDYGHTNEEEELDNEICKEVYNQEIFDDTDFYHQLLRELIEYKSADVTDPVQLGRQWVQLQSLRSKMKRKIDTRATKGRKIRYAVHSKLVNFMAPIDNITWQTEAKSELYNSLFGKCQTINK